MTNSGENQKGTKGWKKTRQRFLHSSTVQFQGSSSQCSFRVLFLPEQNRTWCVFVLLFYTHGCTGWLFNVSYSPAGFLPALFSRHSVLCENPMRSVASEIPASMPHLEVWCGFYVSLPHDWPIGEMHKKSRWSFKRECKKLNNEEHRNVTTVHGTILDRVVLTHFLHWTISTNNNIYLNIYSE